MYVLLSPEHFVPSHGGARATEPDGAGKSNGKSSGNGHGTPGVTQPAHA